MAMTAAMVIIAAAVIAAAPAPEWPRIHINVGVNYGALLNGGGDDLRHRFARSIDQSIEDRIAGPLIFKGDDLVGS